LAPAPYKIKREEEKTDPITEEIIIDEFGKSVMEETEVTIPNFRVVSVFDVAQTHGKELPKLEVKELAIFKSIPQERLHGVPSIGIMVHTQK